MAIHRPTLDMIKATLDTAEGIDGPQGQNYLHTMQAARADIDERIRQYTKIQLLRDFERNYKRQGEWTFEFEAMSGAYCYSRSDGKYHVFFTPDHDDYGWVPVQVNGCDSELIEKLSGRVAFPERTAVALFAAVKPWLVLLSGENDQ